MNLSGLENAIIDLPVKGGRGVLIAGEMILTAAHCISCSCSSQMTLSEDNPVKVRIKGNNFLLNIIFVDPVSDIAVIGPLIDQEYPNPFSEFYKKTKPFKISKYNFLPIEPIPIKIYNIDNIWVNASCEITTPGSHIICIDSDTQIKHGASGGPIINDKFELVSINSQYSFSGNHFSGFAPLPFLTLPKWILNRMK